jgi:GAF domain-containing protein
MTAVITRFRRGFLRRRRTEQVTGASERSTAQSDRSPVEIAPDDPLLAHLLTVSEAVDLDELELDSPALRELRATGVQMVVPLVSQGELIGALNLGRRLSEQAYSSDDRKLLKNLAAQAAPALRVGQLVLEQRAEAVTRQRFEQELEVARLIQQNFLPRSCQTCPGGRSRPTTSRPARSAATSTTSSRYRMAAWASSSAT